MENTNYLGFEGHKDLKEVSVEEGEIQEISL